jgi:hypothetical protein
LINYTEKNVDGAVEDYLKQNDDAIDTKGKNHNMYKKKTYCTVHNKVYTYTVHEFELVKIFDKKPWYDSILAPTFDPACGFEPTSLIHFLAFAVWRA